MFKKQDNNATFLIGQEMSAPKHLSFSKLGRSKYRSDRELLGK